MSPHWSAVLIGIVATAVVKQPVAPPRPSTPIMIAAVSRDKSMLTGGIGPSQWTRQGTVAVEPLGYLTPSGTWSALPCSSDTEETAVGPKNCLAFAHKYLNKPHVYTVVSANGNGAVVHAAPTTLDECYGYTGTGTYSGAAIRKSAIAASSADIFAESVPPRLLSRVESDAVHKALQALVPRRLDTTGELHVVGVRLEDQDMIVIQRAFADVANKTERYKLIFAIGTLDGGGFHILRWKQNTDDDEEALLGTIALKNGRQFLITTVSGSEWQFFRVYGIRAGRLTLIYTGGGSSC
jgi:hypothetical protein